MPKTLFQTVRREYLKFHLRLNPQQSLFFGFFMYMVLGWIFLSLPFSQKIPTNFIDTLFTSTSALSTTGLATVSTFDNYTFFGQFIILTLIQIGGIGYMTLTTYILLSTTKQITHWHKKILHNEFTMPKEFKIQDFLKSVIVFTFTVEIIGAILFYFAFRPIHSDTFFTVWTSIFHSVSSFCTAGFSLYNTSFEAYATNTFLNGIVLFLTISGGLGFIVVTDIWYYFSKKSNSISFTTKMITLSFFGVLFIATAITFFGESTIQHYPVFERLEIATFQTVNAISTAGYNSIPLSNLTLGVLLTIIFLMYVGAAPSSTGGGMKITTLTAVIAIVKSKVRNQAKVTYMNKKIPADRLEMAVSTFIFYTAILFFSVFLLSFTENHSLEKLLFEATSAIGTVGLSMGITGSLSVWGKIILISIMFIGRVGVITFGLAILAKKQHKKIDNETDLAV
ncbi:TrkH family potassium uptake protein [Flavobacterium sp.]|uniref:TrkH family potassium uptake protein n=1 Tax=Flavobacterium sp. TaxID=239 RepID=UPI0008D6777E|nr:potassium transporter TrkG [Flavobacterium sp.]OGS62899.1 MAG: potassium transporter TrkH [Flavobacteria bacterium GWF1_32_7]HBD26004.1 potassium transporter TrkH [Flavobacterium sp.]